MRTTDEARAAWPIGTLVSTRDRRYLLKNQAERHGVVVGYCDAAWVDAVRVSWHGWKSSQAVDIAALEPGRGRSRHRPERTAPEGKAPEKKE